MTILRSSRDSKMKLSLKHDMLIAGAFALAGILTRLPYLALIPVFEDEVLQTVYALSIRPGDFLPLVGDDPYTGPFFSYLLAVCLRVFGSTPIMPRVVVMVLPPLASYSGAPQAVQPVTSIR